MSKQLIDLPVQYLDDEALDIKEHAHVLANFIMSCETPLTIGVQGDWGIGKTSMLNMLKELLSPKQGRKSLYHTIYFNTWQYSQFNQDDMLGFSVIKGILAEIELLSIGGSQDRKDLVKSSIGRFGRFVTNLGNQVVKSKVGVDLDKAVKDSYGEAQSGEYKNDLSITLRELKGEFSRLIKAIVGAEDDLSSGNKLIILIDDLDRIRPLKALELLESIKNFLDVEGCVFVIAVDYSVVQAGMVEKMGKTAQELQGKSYFDKIIQIPFNMPVCSYKMDRYIMSLLGWCFDVESGEYVQIKKEQYYLKIKNRSIDSDSIDFLVNITIQSIGKNPRSIKRVVNYANLLRMIVQASRKGTNKRWSLQDAKLLFPLACMQLEWPELFNYFSEHLSRKTLHKMESFNFLKELPEAGLLFRRYHNPDETMSKITGFVDEYIALIDEDEDGNVSYEEFVPVIEIMQEANMTSYVLKDLDKMWKDVIRMITCNFNFKQHTMSSETIKEVYRLFKVSRWYSLRKFEILNAGKKFVNLLWLKKQVGSIVSTKKEPMQFYLSPPIETILDICGDFPDGLLVDVQNIGHYGVGETKIDLHVLSTSPNSVDIMNKLLNFFDE